MGSDVARRACALGAVVLLGCGAGAQATPVRAAEPDAVAPPAPAAVSDAGSASDPGADAASPSPTAPAADEVQLDLPGGQTLRARASGFEPTLVGELVGSGALSGGWIDLPGITFAAGKADLAGDSAATLDALTTILAAWPTSSISIAVFADARGAASYNLKMSEARGATLRAALADRGVDSARVEVIAPGEYQARCPDRADEACLRQNRRVALVVTAR
jgi:outer membrane protein OmpA-like peptidoglycan-associated protein